MAEGSKKKTSHYFKAILRTYKYEWNIIVVFAMHLFVIYVSVVLGQQIDVGVGVVWQKGVQYSLFTFGIKRKWGFSSLGKWMSNFIVVRPFTWYLMPEVKKFQLAIWYSMFIMIFPWWPMMMDRNYFKDVFAGWHLVCKIETVFLFFGHVIKFKYFNLLSQ